MSETEIIFTPASQANLQYKRIDLEEFLSLIDDNADLNEVLLYRIEKGKNVYDINLNNARYQVFKNNRHCSCCGIQAIRAYLDLDVQTTKKVGYKKYHVNFYSETLDPKSNKVFLTLFVKDKITIASDDESAGNYQPLCFNCACIKMNTKIDFTNEQMKQVLFPAYRAYRSTISLNMAKDFLEDYRKILHKNLRRIVNIKEAFTKMFEADPRVPAMIDKVDESERLVEFLGPACDAFELSCQVGGRFDASMSKKFVKTYEDFLKK